MPVPNWDKNEGIVEQRDLRSSADDHALSDNMFMAHSSSGMSVSEPRGTTVLDANTERCMTFTGNQLPTPNGTSRKPDILDTVLSGQCPRSSEQISPLTDIVDRLLEEIKQIPELFAALSATNAW